MSSFGLLSSFWPFSQQVHVAGLASLIAAAQADPWHLYAIRKRYRRRHVCLACSWLARILAKDARIFEPGYGSGINLLWFGQKGFHNLSGADLSASAINLSWLLAKQLGIDMDIWQDNSYQPKKIPDRINGLLSVNWLYHIRGSSLNHFFEIYKPFLTARGKIAFDMVDAAYNNFGGNEYHTDDLALPKTRRRPSEYTLRLSLEEIERILKKHDLTLLKSARARGPVPRTV